MPPSRLLGLRPWGVEMRVLILHSSYLSGPVSGENRVVADEARLLSEAGHDVEVWSPTPSDGGVWDRVRMGRDVIWAPQADRELVQRMAAFAPDIVHCHNLFPTFSPSVLRVCAARKVPVVVTLHNYRLLCPPGTFVRGGRICEDCLGRGTWRSVVHSCYRGSKLASAALSASLAIHRGLGSFDVPVTYLAVSRFMRTKYIQAGFSPERIKVKSNFAWPVGGSKERDHFLFLGRLTPEKGAATLIRSWGSVPARLKIVGDGPEAARLRMEAPGNVDFVGPVPAEEVPRLLAGARALMVPSEWYEGQPRTIIEAFAAGVPVVASDVGGLPELVEDGVNGLLVEVGDRDGWTRAALEMMDGTSARRMSRAALDTWKNRFTPERALAELEGLYQMCLDGSATGTVPGR